MKNLEEKIFDYIGKHLSPKRFEHSYEVARLAAELAAIHGQNVLKAQTAGLLHDCAKYKSDKELLKLLKGSKTPYFKEIAQHAPQLLHGYAAAVIVRKKFNIKDDSVLNAMANHTFARPNMSELEKILFVSDFAAYDRKHKSAASLRRLARKDLDKAFIEVLKSKIKWVMENSQWLCPITTDVWNFYGAK